MSKCHKLRQRWNEFNKKIMLNSKNMCDDCDEGNRSSDCVQNNHKNQEEKERNETQCNI